MSLHDTFEKEDFDPALQAEDYSDHQVVRKPTTIDERVEVKGSGPLSMAPVEETEKVLEELSIEFDGWMYEEMERLTQVWHKICHDQNVENHIRDFYKSVLDVKGQAATLGYPFAGLIASNLFDLLSKMDRDVPKEYVDLYIDSIRIIVEKKIKGMDHPKVCTIASSLDEITYRHTHQLT